MDECFVDSRKGTNQISSFTITKIREIIIIQKLRNTYFFATTPNSNKLKDQKLYYLEKDVKVVFSKKNIKIVLSEKDKNIVLSEKDIKFVN